MSQPQNPPLPIPIRHELLQSETIAHGFFTRNGGVSPAPFQSLNLGLGSSDDPDNIRQNRARVALSLGFEPENLVSLYQIHSPLVVDIQTPLALDSRPQADSMISQTKGLLLGILTADCAPILFMDETAAIVGAVHAGWRGAVSGIIENTISAMVAKGAQKSSIKAVIGPCIAQKSYEVSLDFKDAILAKSISFQTFFAPSHKPDKCHFDLAGFCLDALKRAGIEQIAATHLDTCALEDQFFSYRRGTLRGEPDYGRLISVIGLRMR